VFQYLAQHDGIKRLIHKGKARRIGFDDISPRSIAEDIDGRRGEIRARHVEARFEQQCREGALACSDVEDLPRRIR
jgi:hypothetical protein